MVVTIIVLPVLVYPCIQLLFKTGLDSLTYASGLIAGSDQPQGGPQVSHCLEMK